MNPRRRYFTFDCETHYSPESSLVVIQPGVCFQYAWGDEDAEVLLMGPKADAVFEAALRDRRVVLVGHNVFFDFGVMLGRLPHLLPLVVEAFERGRVRCTQIRQRLIDIADPSSFKAKVSMAAILKRVLKVDITHLKEGDDIWRFRYAELDGVPVNEWPEAAREYALMDVHHTREIFYRQGKDRLVSPCELDQMRAYFALHLASMWGMKTDLSRVAAKRADLEQSLRDANEVAIEAGYVRVDLVKDWHRDDIERSALDVAQAGDVELIMTAGGKVSMAKKQVKLLAATAAAADHPDADRWAAYFDLKDLGRNADPLDIIRAEKRLADLGWLTIEERYCTTKSIIQEKVLEVLGDEAPLTDHPERPTIKTDKETLELVAALSGENALLALVRRNRATKYISTYIVPMEAGYMRPSFSLVDSGRTSARWPNVQNFPRDGGMRECVIPRPGMVFVQADYSQIELVCYARLLDDFTVTTSSMTKALLDGKDLHLWVAARMLHTTYEDVAAVKAEVDALPEGAKKTPRQKEVMDARQRSKMANYGFMGGMGAETFRKHCATQGLVITLEEAKLIREVWLAAWPEAQYYLDKMGDLTRDGGTVIEQIPSGRRRAVQYYSQTANTFFQGMAADGAKRAIWAVTKASLLDPASPLFGYRLVNFVHDELILEGPPEGADEALAELMRVMVEGMKQVIDQDAQVLPPGGYPVEADGKVLADCWRK